MKGDIDDPTWVWGDVVIIGFILLPILIGVALYVGY